MSLLLSPDVGINALSDGELAGPLADLSQVSAGEALGHLGQKVQVHILGHRALPQVGLQDRHPGAVIGEGNVDQLIKTTRSKMKLCLHFNLKY